MAKKLSAVSVNLSLSMIICLWLLTHIQGQEYDQRQAFIVYMGNQADPEVPVLDIYLKMIEDVLGRIPDSTQASDYLLHTYESFQGFVANLTEEEAEQITRMAGVVSVFYNEVMDPDTTRSWDFMGLDMDVQRSDTESDVIVGVIDTGIWPESDSFSDEGFSPPPSKWKGQCQNLLNFTCNNKVIGARYFRVGGSSNLSEDDFQSPIDSNGHGTHTASIVAGRVVDKASFLGLGEGTARGGVPSARIAVYKVCWSDGCSSADVLAAFDAAISDGVDIISVSLGGIEEFVPYFKDPYVIGAFHAMQRGILTSISAGNDGPTLQSTSKGAPWYLSVAASTIDRKFITTVELGNGMVVKGISLNTFDYQNKTFPLIYGGDAPYNLSTYSSTCEVDSLNKTLVKDKIVVCDSYSDGAGAYDAGAAGIIMQGLDGHDKADSFPLSASYLLVADATPVISYARTLTSTPYATILKSVAISDPSAPIVASFSSRGPNPNSPGILKVYIVYMGHRANSEVPVNDIHLKMIEDVLGRIPDFTKASDYLMHTYENFQGFVANFTEKEADQISRMAGVVSVFPYEIMHPDTTRSWDFLGMPMDVKRSNTESDVIVGVIDYGIWPESKSFSDKGLSPPPSKWKGQCTNLLNFTCNNKIIGARYFRLAGLSSLSDKDIISPRDSNGHGTHTASIVAGGVVDEASFLGLGEGVARGGVPSARIAVYKVCWLEGCSNADIIAAFDAAISDGVDIISVSLGSVEKQFSPYFEDPYAIGAFHAMQSGILTSVSAGNFGPTLHSTFKGAPWYLSVAASTIDRKFTTTVKLGNGMVVKGISLNPFDHQNQTFPLIYGGDAPYDSSISSSTCQVGSLNHALVKGKIVVCDDASRKGEGAFRAGAAGIIMQDLYRHDVVGYFPLSASYLQVADATPVVSYARNLTSSPYATILKSVAINDPSAPIVASFSSRGPNPNSPGILKPDLTAPGVNILAAYSPIVPLTQFEDKPRHVSYKIIWGTSMACPHATAVAAYVKSFHPTWSPSAIKSALMTSAFPMSSAANAEAEFAYGSGHINPLKAVNPGLVYHTGEDDYIKFLCSEGLTETEMKSITRRSNICSILRGEGFSNWDLNYPSMALPTTAGAFDAVFRSHKSDLYL